MYGRRLDGASWLRAAGAAMFVLTGKGVARNYHREKRHYTNYKVIAFSI
jgi:hypothetical protein